jgi:hypothetical protein
MKKFHLILYLIGLATIGIIAWRFTQAPTDSMGAKNANTRDHLERGMSGDPMATRNANTTDRQERRKSRVSHHKARRAISDLLENPDSMGRAAVEALDGHLAHEHRSAQSLLAAFQISGDIALLREAAERFPDEPSVQLEMALRGQSPEERRKALDALCESDPENALVDYLGAIDHIKQGDLESAFKDLTVAAGKPELDSYDLSIIQAREDAFLAADFSPAEAKAAGMFALPLDYIEPIKDLSNRLFDLQNDYARTGDVEAAESVRQMGQQLGRQIQAGNSLFLQELIGMSIERRFLNPTTSEARIAEINQRISQFKELNNGAESSLSNTLSNMSDTEVILYTERIKHEGEEAANQWLLELTLVNLKTGGAETAKALAEFKGKGLDIDHLNRIAASSPSERSEFGHDPLADSSRVAKRALGSPHPAEAAESSAFNWPEILGSALLLAALGYYLVRLRLRPKT